MGSARSTPSFSQSFEVHHALEVAISVAHRARSSIDLEAVVAALRSTFPDHPTSEAELRRAVIAAAERADVPVAATYLMRRLPVSPEAATVS